MVNLRVTAIGRLQGPAEAVAEAIAGVATEAVPEHRRPVWFDGDRPVDTPVYDRDKLLPDQELMGPAVIEQLDATTLLGPGDCCRVAAGRNLMVELAP